MVPGKYDLFTMLVLEWTPDESLVYQVSNKENVMIDESFKDVF